MRMILGLLILLLSIGCSAQDKTSKVLNSSKKRSSVVQKQSPSKNTAPKAITQQKSWKQVGGEISSGDISYITLAFDKNLLLYIAYKDLSQNRKIFVKKIEDGSWIEVGQLRNTESSIDVRLAFLGGTPYTAYIDKKNNENKIIVNKFE